MSCHLTHMNIITSLASSPLPLLSHSQLQFKKYAICIYTCSYSYITTCTVQVNIRIFSLYFTILRQNSTVGTYMLCTNQTALYCTFVIMNYKTGTPVDSQHKKWIDIMLLTHKSLLIWTWTAQYTNSTIKSWTEWVKK